MYRDGVSEGQFDEVCVITGKHCQMLVPVTSFPGRILRQQSPGRFVLHAGTAEGDPTGDGSCQHRPVFYDLALILEMGAQRSNPIACRSVRRALMCARTIARQ